MNGKNTIDNENFETHFISTYENGYLPVGWNDMFTLPSGEEAESFYK